MNRNGRIGSMLICLLAAGPAFAADMNASTDTWLGPKLKGRPRENVFGFAKRPTCRKVGRDRYEITFASKGRCDVALAIHDAKGKIVRYLVAGVLGPNAPAPLQKDSLEQRIIWNGKDDFGEYIPDPEQCKARVSLGLSPVLDKVMCRHPKDVTGGVHAIGADKDGVYVATDGPCQIKLFTHDAQYVRTLWPWSAEDFAAGKVIGETTGWPPGGENAPRVGGYGASGWAEGPSHLSVVNGKMLLFTVGWRAVKRALRVGTDGTTRGENYGGPVISRGRSHIYGRSAYAISPDGVWIYYTPLGKNQHGKTSGMANCKHAIYRLAWAEKGPLGQPYIGEESASQHARGGDNRKLNNPQAVACDAKGRIYVSDAGNNRIQVFKPTPHEGTWVKTIPISNPRQLAIDQKTGEIYVQRHGKAKRVHGPRGWYMGADSELVKIGGFDNPKVVASWKLPWLSPRPVVGVDTWSKPVRVWFGSGTSIQVYEIVGKELKPFSNFDEEVRKDGYNPHMVGGKGVAAMTKVIPQPGGNRLYYELSKGGIVYCVDVEEGKKLMPVYRDWRGTFNHDEIHCGIDGYYYVRGIAWVGRFKHPRGPVSGHPYGKTPGLLVQCEDEVPFDYGEAYSVDMNRSAGMRGVIRVPSVPGGNYFNMGFGVTPTGDILALCENHAKKLEYKDRGELGLNEVGMRNYLKFLAEGTRPFNPQLIPGTLQKGQYVFVFDRRGELKSENAIPVPSGPTCGIRGDREGNIYLGIAMHCKDDRGKPLPYDGAGAGAVCKFAPKGGLIYGKGSPLPKNRPVEFGAHYGEAAFWTRNMFWKYNGYGIVPVSDDVCSCPNGRFDVDILGRSFVPEHWRHSVAIVDTNGNLITRIGRYENADSGTTPGGPVTIGWCSATGVDPDRYLYLPDVGNSRILRVRLSYAVEERIGLQ